MVIPPLVRPYRGTPAQDRVAQRREALLDAALHVFDADGWSGVSARRVCDEAGLTRRYFYESFEDVDALMGALFEEITGEVRAAVRTVVAAADAPPADLARRAVSRGLDVLMAVPAKGRFVASAQSAGGAVAAHRARALDDLASIVERGFIAEHVDAAPPLGAAPPVGSGQARVAAVAVVGAVLRIIDSWLGGELDVTRDEAVAWSTAAGLGAMAAVTTAQR
ncbi:TetR/AcrR family transcriptional regulator [Streptomyces montanisoli]|uniref:TetR/AcrR family transcriptional regulator n=1 Tax=Streptomyces montanisoli TaxID=2798581 RepID=A0A940MCZ8_9ACTN|nr:TetR/AcrR family transcriptional regulator [Streptomyces montanisoli]MBP0459004.1 TetR/AcrR family transcriptional regulator [Streptomyces montanisoli]